MEQVAPLALRPAARIDPIPVAWGGLVASIGLMAGSGRDWPLRLAAAAVTFGVGGFLAGVRADARRPLHAVAAGVAAYVIHAGFVAIARIIDALGGPDAPALVPGTGRDGAIAAAFALAFALIGGLLAHAWLTPAGRSGR
jgi:hypothetical protein